MSTKEAAKFLGLSERTIFRLIDRDLITAEKFGNYWMIDRESVEEYAAAVAGKSKHDPTRSTIED